MCRTPYTLRCLPQIHGASKNALNYIIEQIEVEMNSVTDNPIIFPQTQEVISTAETSTDNPWLSPLISWGSQWLNWQMWQSAA